MREVMSFIDTAHYGDMTIDYLSLEDGYGCRVHFEGSDIGDIIKGKSIEEAWQNTIEYLTRLRKALDTWR